MIEVNLLPGAPKRSKRRGLPSFSLSLPSVSGLPRVDRIVAGLVAAWVLAPALVGWMWMGDRSRNAELDAAIQIAVEDSTRYAKLIAASERLQARRDTIAQKLQIIQEIDAERFVWSHLLDEVSGATPEYTWLRKIVQLDTGIDEIAFEVHGQTGNNFALTRFMTQLEASPFVSSVKLTSMDLAQASAEAKHELVYDFILQAAYEVPPADVIQTVPIFGEQD